MVTELSYYLALSHTFLSSAVLLRLVKALGSAQAVWEASDRALEGYLKPAQLDKLRQARQRHTPEALLALYQRLGIQPLTVDDRRYPALLRLIYDPPLVLYVRGNPEALSSRAVAVVGTRRFTDYGMRATETVVAQLAPYQPCIVSGLAAGIDTCAHQAALKNRLPTVAVFGTAIDEIYPRTNQGLAQHILEAGGALVSEFAVGTPGAKANFPKRNRVVAGMSQGVLVVEGGEKSGARITAQCALDENRHVFALPGSIFNPMALCPNRLIQEGAYLVQQGTDIAQVLHWETTAPFSPGQLFPDVAEGPAKEAVTLSRLEQDVLTLIGYEPTPFDAIIEGKVDLSAQDLNFALTVLEMQGLIRSLPGSQFCRN